MSAKIVCQTELHDSVILRETLKELGLTYTEQGDEVLQIINSSYPITINMKTGDVNYDSDQSREIDKIKQQYAFNFIRDQYLKEGTDIHHEVEANGTIHIYSR